MSTLDGPRFLPDGPSLGSLKTAEEVAKVVRISAERILELSRAEVLPHFRIDGGQPLFSVPILRAYVRRHLTVECDGAPLPLDLRPVVLKPVTESVPIALTMVQHSQAGRAWERALFLPVPKAELLHVETQWIRTLKPSWNRSRFLKDSSQ